MCCDGCGLPGECGEGVCVVMGVDYQERVWGGCVCDGCGLPGEGVGRECVW